MAKPSPKFTQESRGNFINGEFGQPVDPNGEWKVLSPGDLKDEVGNLFYAYADVDRAVDAAREGFKTWKKTNHAERATLLKKYQENLKRRQDEFAELIAREVGKPLWEAKTEIGAMIGKIDITINESMKFVEGFDLKEVLPATDGICRYRPMGVMAVLGPFNFPGHLPNGHIVPALMTGNTVIFKPSEKTPMVGQLMAECFQEAGFPQGVFNLIQGEKEVGRRLAVHEGVSGILFTGSYEVGTRIKQDTLQQHWKILALEMGGKNTAIVWDDADLDVAIRETLAGAYLTTGQRCSATGRIVVHKSLVDRFQERFHERAKAFSIGHPLEEHFMGALIDSSIVDRYMKFMGIASREGCDLVMRGKPLEFKDYEGHYVAPSICRVKDVSVEGARKSVYQQTELFAPNVCIMATEEVEEAAALANATQYGLAASVFTKDRKTYEKLWSEIDAGIINWNRATVGASSKLPFGGLKKSGNHQPTALTATLYCTYPVASLETKAPKAGPGNYPGLNWE